MKYIEGILISLWLLALTGCSQKPDPKTAELEQRLCKAEKTIQKLVTSQNAQYQFNTNAANSFNMTLDVITNFQRQLSDYQIELDDIILRQQHMTSVLSNYFAVRHGTYLLH